MQCSSSVDASGQRRLVGGTDIESDLTLYLMYKYDVILDHLRFKHAQPKMCHSPKVEDKVESYFFFFLGPILLDNLD